MIASFGDKLTEELFRDERVRQWRVVFKWIDGEAHEVWVVDYH